MSILAQNIWSWLSGDLRRLAVFISLLISLWIIFTNDTVNIDGALYLDAAYQINQSNWEEATKLYRWLFYPALIAAFSNITMLDLEPAALLLNSIIFCAITWQFLTLLSLTGADKKTLWIGLLVISIHPAINEYRADLLRGYGHWLFIIMSAQYLINYTDRKKWFYLAGWAISILISSLFRIEGLVYFILVPVFLLVSNIKLLSVCSREMCIKIISTILFFAVLVFSLFYYFDTSKVPHATILDRFFDAIDKTIPELGKDNQFGTAGVYLSLVITLLLTIAKKTTILLLMSAMYAEISRNIRPLILHNKILIAYLATNLLILIIFILSKQYLSGRFSMVVVLFLSIISCHGLRFLLFNINISKYARTFTRGVVIIFLTFIAIDGLISFGSPKTYIKDAGLWLRHNIKETDKILTNHPLINHYANVRQGSRDREVTLGFGWFLGTLQAGNYRYLIDEEEYKYIAVRSKNLSEETLKELDMYLGEPIKIFSGPDNKKIYVYKDREL